MISNGLATVLFAIALISAGVLGIGAGGLTCLALRLRWSLKVALIDGALASVVAFIAAYVGAAIEIARGVLESGVSLILGVAVGSVVLRHLLPLAFRSRE